MSQENIFYTKEHEWIRFSGSCAYVGISKFKLTGIHKIENIGLSGLKPGDIVSQGSSMLQLYYKEYVLPVHAPITCKLLAVNSIITDRLWEEVISYPESEGWLFMVEPVNGDKSHLTNKAIYQERFAPISSLNPDLIL